MIKKMKQSGDGVRGVWVELFHGVRSLLLVVWYDAYLSNHR